MRKYTWLIALSLAATPQLASAQTLTFEGQNNIIYDAPITRSGFVIANGPNDEQHFHEIDSTQFGLASNGTGVLLNDRDTSIFLTAVGGGAFNLSSFDIAASFNNSPGTTFTATGSLGGLTIGTISGDLGQFATFAGFGSSVDRVVFNGLGGGGGFELDNVVLNGRVTGSVPEPTTWAMMLLGFGGIGFSMRSARRKAKLSFAAA